MTTESQRSPRPNQEALRKWWLNRSQMSGDTVICMSNFRKPLLHPNLPWLFLHFLPQWHPPNDNRSQRSSRLNQAAPRKPVRQKPKIAKAQPSSPKKKVTLRVCPAVDGSKRVRKSSPKLSIEPPGINPVSDPNQNDVLCGCGGQ